MTLLRRQVVPGLMLLALSPLTANASEQAPHVHGVGNLDIAIEGESVKMQLRAPGADIVGFEHAATSAADREAIHEAEEKLVNAKALFSFPEAAHCHAAEAHMEHEEDSHGDDKDHDEHKHDEHAKKHDEHKDHAEKHDEHKDHKDHGEKHEESHSEFHAEYGFKCEHPEKVAWMETTYFKTFPKAGKLNVRILSATGQKAVTLSSGSARLKF